VRRGGASFSAARTFSFPLAAARPPDPRPARAAAAPGGPRSAAGAPHAAPVPRRAPLRERPGPPPRSSRPRCASPCCGSSSHPWRACTPRPRTSRARLGPAPLAQRGDVRALRDPARRGGRLSQRRLVRILQQRAARRLRLPSTSRSRCVGRWGRCSCVGRLCQREQRMWQGALEAGRSGHVPPPCCTPLCRTPRRPHPPTHPLLRPRWRRASGRLCPLSWHCSDAPPAEEAARASDPDSEAPSSTPSAAPALGSAGAHPRRGAARRRRAARLTQCSRCCATGRRIPLAATAVPRSHPGLRRGRGRSIWGPRHRTRRSSSPPLKRRAPEALLPAWPARWSGTASAGRSGTRAPPRTPFRCPPTTPEAGRASRGRVGGPRRRSGGRGVRVLGCLEHGDVLSAAAPAKGWWVAGRCCPYHLPRGRCVRRQRGALACV